MAMMLDESEASDAELIGRAKGGDRGVFSTLL
ncbi:RNA polymerase subunit sigma-70, partial [Mesorhizobium sp. M7A.T.Ca.TU.009.01.3.2]